MSKSISLATAKPAIHAPQLLDTGFTGFLRINQILGDDTHPAIIPIGRTSWWNGVKSGRFPKPVKLGARTTAWRVEDIKALVESMGVNV